MEFKIKIAEDFSKTPGARYYEDGNYSGQEFFDKILLPRFLEAREKNQVLVVDLDDTEGYATSFLDEAFRRLSLKCKADVVLNNIKIISDEEPDWIDEIKDYIKNANDGKK